MWEGLFIMAIGGIEAERAQPVAEERTGGPRQRA